MADQSSAAIKLPAPSDAPATQAPAASAVPAAPVPGSTATAATGDSAQQELPAGQLSDEHSRDFAIGAGVLVVLLIAFFFAKNAYANMLVARKVAPRSANAAGWWLFILLGSLSAAVVFGAIDQDRFLTILYLLPLGVIALVSLVLLVLSSRR